MATTILLIVWDALGKTLRKSLRREKENISGAYTSALNSGYKPKQVMATKQQAIQLMQPRYLQSGVPLLKCMLNRVRLEIKEPNLSYVLGYYEALKRAAKNDRTIARQLREVRFLIGALGNKDAKKATEADIDKIVLAVTESKKAAISRWKMLLTMRVFWGFLYGKHIDSHDYPEIVKNVRYTIRNLRREMAKTQKTAADIPTLEEVKAMVEVSDSHLEKLVVMLFASTGMRVGEALNTTIGSLQLSKDPNTLSHIVVSGKTSTRTIPLLRDLVPFIKTYLDEERKGALSNEPLLVYKGKALDYDHLRFILKKLSKNAKVSHKIHSHIFRYYLSSYFARNGRQESQMSAFFGYSPQIARTYTKLENADSILEEASERPNRKMLEEKTCKKCGIVQPFSNKLCSSCMGELSSDAEEMSKVRQELKDMKDAFNGLMSVLDKGTKEKILEVLKGGS